MNKFILVTQSFAENKGSFSGFAEKLAREASSRYEVQILCAQERSQKLSEDVGYAKIHRFKTIRLPLFSNVWIALSQARMVNRHLKELNLDKNDIIIANGEAALGTMNYPFFLRAGDQPVNIFQNNMELAKNETSLATRAARYAHTRLLYFIEKGYFPKARAIIYSSEETRELFEKEYNVKKPYFIPHSGVKSMKGGKDLSIRGRKLLFISGNSEKIRKGQPYLEKALPGLFNAYGDLKLIHLGGKFDWKVPESMKDRIYSYERAPWDKIRDFYASSDLLVSCSVHEMFPNTIIEAMSVGLPVITSDIQGASEYLTHLKSGYIYKRGDVGGLKEGICFMLDNQGKAKEMAKNAVITAEKIKEATYYPRLLKAIEDWQKGNSESINLLR